MRLITPTPLVAIIAIIMSGLFAHAGGPCGSTCGPMRESFQSSFYVGVYGGFQHAADYTYGQSYRGNQDLDNVERGESSDSCGHFGAHVGYLHRFCDTNCALGFEGFADYGCLETLVHERIAAERVTFDVEHKYSFGGSVRPGYVLCEGHMFYGVLGARWQKFEASHFDQGNTPPRSPTTTEHVLGMIFGLGWEMEFGGCHRVRFQATQTRYCQMLAQCRLTVDGGYTIESASVTHEFTVGYSFVF